MREIRKPKFSIGQKVKPMNEAEFQITQIAFDKSEMRYSAHLRKWYLEDDLEPVKPKKTITLYRSTYYAGEEGHYWQGDWGSNKPYPSDTRVHTEEKTLEIEE